MYNFQKLKQLTDLRNKIKKSANYQTVGINSKTDIAIHHSATPLTGGSGIAFSTYHHDNNGWKGGCGYHFVITANGTIEWTQNPDVLSYHVGDANKQAIGVCLVGNFTVEKPTESQLQSLRDLHSCLVKDMPNYKRTLGHSDYPQYSWKACPVFDYKKAIFGNSNSSPPPSTSSASTHIGIATILSNDGLNVRETPSLDSKIIKSLPKGTAWKVYSVAKNGWLEISKNQWISGGSSYVKYIPNPTHIGIVTVLSDDGLNVRDQPSANGKILDNLKNGTSWKTYEINNGWYRVSIQGWLNGKYVAFQKV